MNKYSRAYHAQGWSDPSRELVFPEISFDEPDPVPPVIPEATAQGASATAARPQPSMPRAAGPSSGSLPDATFIVRDADGLRTALQAQTDRPILRTGTALVGMGLVTQAQVDVVLAQRGAEAGLPMGERLVRAGYLSRGELQAGLLRRMAYPQVDLARFPTDVDLLRRLPLEKALQLKALPLALQEQQLVVVMADPSCIDHLNELKFVLQRRIRPALCWQGDLPVLIRSAYARHRLGGTDDRWVG